MTEVTLGWMDAVGVDAALLNPKDSIWSRIALAKWPDRLAEVPSVRSDGADAGTMVKRAQTAPEVVGLRLVIGRRPVDPTGGQGRADLRAGVFDRLFASAEDARVPLFVFATGLLGDLRYAVEKHPGLTIIIDHMGVRQPPMDEAAPQRWGELDEVIEFAAYPNVAVKLCGAPALSREGFPFADVRAPISRLIRAFGADRLAWASDISRFQGRIGIDHAPETGRGPYAGRHTYAESLALIRDLSGLSAADRDMILGGTVRRLTGWPSSNTREL